MPETPPPEKPAPKAPEPKESAASRYPILALALWLGVTILYVAIVFLIGAKDWGDNLYAENPALQLQDKMSAAFQVGLASGLYLPAVIWLILRGTTKHPARVRVIAAIAVLAISVLVVAGVGSRQVQVINKEARYIQN